MASSGLAGALVYLRSRSLLNLLAARLRRLRQPKYVAGAVMGIAYLYFVFVSRLSPRPGRASPVDDMADQASLFPALAAAGLLVFVALNWVLRRERASLGFSDAEIAFLFPAPATRRALVHYRIISLGIAGVFTALVMALVSTRWHWMPGNYAMRAVGWWLVFGTLSLHAIASGFTLTRCTDRGAPPGRCQLLAILAVAALVGVPLLWAGHAIGGGASWTSVLASGPLAWLLLPFRLVAGPLLAGGAGAWLMALLPALLIYALHYFWLLRMQVGFEDGSIARAEKRAARLAAMRAGNWRLAGGRQKARRDPFDLGRVRRPEFAFLWKNLLSAAPYLRPRNALVTAACIVGVNLWLADSGFFQSMRPMLGMVSLGMMAYTLVFGPHLARQDFRSDLANTDILKTWPLRGWQIMLGEMLTPVAILTGIAWLMLLAAAVMFPSDGQRLSWLTTQVRTLLALGLGLVVPLLCMSQVLIVNAMAVLFPAWQTAAGQPQQGIEVMGQRMLFLAAQLLAMMLMLVPPFAVAAGAFATLRLVSPSALAAGAALAIAVVVLVVELGLLIAWLGHRFEQLDLSKELRP